MSDTLQATIDRIREFEIIRQHLDDDVKAGKITAQEAAQILDGIMKGAK
jgi:polyhydroxyalkanoate synthesis regulator phasin